MKFTEVYMLCRWRNLLINRKVAGIYVAEKPSRIPEGYYFQHINLRSRDYYFVYKEFSIKVGFALTFKQVKVKVESSLAELLESIQEDVKMNGKDPGELEFFTEPLSIFTWAGNPNTHYGEEKEDFVYIKKDSKELFLVMGRGRILPKRAYELPFHPLFFFPKKGIFPLTLNV